MKVRNLLLKGNDLVAEVHLDDEDPPATIVVRLSAISNPELAGLKASLEHLVQQKARVTLETFTH